MSDGDAVRVPLAVDAVFRVRVGPAALPVRSVALCAVVSPLAYLLLGAPLPGLWSVCAALFVLAFAALCGVPEREGVWIGTHLVYRQAWRVMPTVIVDGQPRRARLRAIAGGVRVIAANAGRGRLHLATRVAGTLGSPPRVVGTDAGVLQLAPGGHVAVLLLTGPSVSPGTEAHLSWCARVTAWLAAQRCPAQLLTSMAHQDSERVGRAFDARVAGWPRTPLRALERAVATSVSDRTIALRHAVVLSPGSAAADGIPHRSVMWRRRRATDTPETSASRALQTALRTAPSFGLDVAAADRDDIAAMVSGSALGWRDAYAGDQPGAHAAGEDMVVLTVTALPSWITAGGVVEAMLRARCTGTVSLHILPVASATVQRELHRRTVMLRHAALRGADPVESQVALQDAVHATAALASRDLVPVRVALTAALSHHDRDEAAAAAERFAAVLASHGFRVTDVTSPALLPVLALSPGGAPLRRSLLLTTDGVAARMLPCLGTPFGDSTAPLLGLNLVTGAPVHLSVWRQTNHNAVILGSSGAGKSVAAKTLLVRHVMEGAAAAVLDPDSEYEPVMRAVGGSYHELGEHALNPLDCGDRSPDERAATVLPVLSVMAGDERGIAERRPIRRLADEDLGWLHAELVEFFRAHAAAASTQPPLLRELIAELDVRLHAQSLTGRQRERGQIITSRLRRFTQGALGELFDRPSTFAVGDHPVAVGMRHIAMTYGADLTPVFAVLLTALLGAVERRRSRLLVVVDEAHRITADPDAGEVLGQLVRQARKHGAGVWMVSQNIDEFVSTELGRTLAATAATKLIMGTEEAASARVSGVFALSSEEAAAICPPQPGIGVLVSGAERAMVAVLPGDALLSVASTSAAVGPLSSRCA